MRRTLLLAILILSPLACTGPSDSHIPQVGRYRFTTTWPIAGFAQPADADGELAIATASETEIAWTFTLNESSGPKVKTGTSSWSEENGYVVVSTTIGRAGPWQVFPHLIRTGSGYDCYGNAVLTTTFSGTPMTCTFAYLGP